MIIRRLLVQLTDLLAEYHAVAVIGPRQVGKTTLAKEFLADREGLYLDLELQADRVKLDDPEHFLGTRYQQLVVLDGIQRYPELFQSLRGLIDRHPQCMGRFLILGSASVELLRQSSESLAGRIAYLELSSFDVTEVTEHERLWLRGGFPRSFLASHDRISKKWRDNLIRTHLEHDIPQLGPRIPASTMHRLWRMLAHMQGGMLNNAVLARNLSVSGKTISRYLDLLSDLLLVRKIEPWKRNVGKRLVKSPKIYVRDSGILHALLNISTIDDLLGHPIVGSSWEGFIIENILAIAPDNSDVCFYRSTSGAEIDLVLTLADKETWAIEIKRSLATKPDKGFHYACTDIKANRKLVVYAGEEHFSLRDNTEFISLKKLLYQIDPNLTH